MPEIHKEYIKAVKALEPLLYDLPARVIAIDGRDGVGKTTLGRYLAWHFNVTLVETDLFTTSKRGVLQYYENEILRVVTERLKKPRPVIIEGVAMLQLLEQLKLNRDYYIYVSNKNQSGGLGLKRMLKDYESYYEPKKKADLVLKIKLNIC